MKAQITYFTTVYTTQAGVVLYPISRPNAVETYCEAFLSSDKRKRAKEYDGYYFNQELSKA